MSDERKEKLARVREALSKLDDVGRQILTMRHFDKLKNRDVAAALGISAQAASQKYIQALAAVKQLLGR